MSGVPSLTWFDFLVIGVLLVSVVLSLLRGLVAEVAALGIWVAAFLGANWLAPIAAEPFAKTLAEPLRLTLAFLVVFVLVFLLGGLLKAMLRELIDKTGAGPIDRVLGACFGLARGLLILTLLLVLASMTSLPRQDAWQRAASRPLMEVLLKQSKPWLPGFIRERMSPSV